MTRAYAAADYETPYRWLEPWRGIRCTHSLPRPCRAQAVVLVNTGGEATCAAHTPTAVRRDRLAYQNVGVENFITATAIPPPPVHPVDRVRQCSFDYADGTECADFAAFEIDSGIFSCRRHTPLETEPAPSRPLMIGRPARPGWSEVDEMQDQISQLQSDVEELSQIIQRMDQELSRAKMATTPIGPDPADYALKPWTTTYAEELLLERPTASRTKDGWLDLGEEGP